MVFFLHVIFLPLSHPFTSNPIKVYYIFGEKNESRALCVFRITSNPTSGKVAMVHTKRTLFLSIVLIVALSLDPARSFAHTVNLENKARVGILLEYFIFKRRGTSVRGNPNYPLGELYLMYYPMRKLLEMFAVLSCEQQETL